jgi:hypothetical protein
MTQKQTEADETTIESGREPTRTALERHWIAVLAEYWRQTDWDAFGTAKKSYADTFGERVEVATRAGGVHAALDKLAKGLGMATPELPTADLDPLVTNDSRAMQILRREDIWLVNKADETVRSYFDGRDSGQKPKQTTTDLSDFITLDDSDEGAEDK